MQSETSKKAPAPYRSNLEYIQDELGLLNMVLQTYALGEHKRSPASPLDDFKGLVITEDEVAGILVRLGDAWNNSEPRDTEELIAASSDIHIRRQISLDSGISLPLARLTGVFSLTRFEETCIIIALASELDRRYEKVYAYLLDDVTQRRPTVELMLNLSCRTMHEKIKARSAFLPQATLFKYRLLRATAQEGQSLLSYPLKLDDRIVDYLLNEKCVDSRLLSFVRLMESRVAWNNVTCSPQTRKRMEGFVDALWIEDGTAAQKTIFSFFGSDFSAKMSLAEATGTQLGLPILFAEFGEALLCLPNIMELLILLGREAILQNAILCMNFGDSLTTTEDKDRFKALHQAQEFFPPVTFLFSDRRLCRSMLSRECLCVEEEFAIPSSEQRKQLWTNSIDGSFREINADTVEALAGKFRITGSDVKNALTEARNQARWQAAGKESEITLSQLNAACRAQSQELMHKLLFKIEPKYCWSDIILPLDSISQLKDMSARISSSRRVLGEWGFEKKLSLGKGNNALFVGPSGTGKTMAAEIIANELGLDLYRIDLSGVVSKYIGETEKNLDRIFTAAENASVILFFDEADALFGKRSEVHNSNDRYSNMEVSYLLQKIEQYDGGITILTTNLRQNIDSAFLRRLQFIVEFPFPDEEQRLLIWKSVFPAEAPRDMEIDFELLSKNLRITGGNIKNIVLSAAYLAAANGGKITMPQLLHAARREYGKLGKIFEETGL